MTAKLATLKIQAGNACKMRGHKPTKFYRAGEHGAWAGCKNRNCGGRVWVNEKPAANDIDISGDMVAMNCPITTGNADYFKNPKRKKNPSRGEVDMNGARELYLTIDNDSRHYNQKRNIIQNLMLKKKKGIYKLDLACKLWRYWIDAGAKSYAKDHGVTFNVPTRNAAAEMVTENEDAKMSGGEYGNIATYKRNPKARTGRQKWSKERRAEFAAKMKAARERKRGVKKNPKGVHREQFVICIGKGGSKRMYFSGGRFSSELPPEKFDDKMKAYFAAVKLRDKYPILDRYKMTVEPLGK